MRQLSRPAAKKAGISPPDKTAERTARRWAALMTATAVLWAAASMMLCGPAIGAESIENIEGVVRSTPHDFSDKKRCAVCHQDQPPALGMDPMATCTKCHHGNVANHPVSRHPLGMTPKMSVPAYLPLSKDGKMVCFTCHDPHDRSGIDKMLRVTFKKLCASCHAGY